MWEDNLDNEEYERLIYDYDFSEFATGGYNASSSAKHKNTSHYADEDEDLTATDSNDD